MMDTMIRLSRLIITVTAVGAVVLCLAEVCQTRTSKVFYSLQVGAFKRLAYADLHATNVAKKKKLPCFYQRADIPGKGVWYRVYLGKFANPNDARSYAARLKVENVIDCGPIRKFEDDDIQDVGGGVTEIKAPTGASGTVSKPNTMIPPRHSLSKKPAAISVKKTAATSDITVPGPCKSKPSRDVDERVEIFWCNAGELPFRFEMIEQSRMGNQFSCGMCRRYGDTDHTDAYPADYDEEAWLGQGPGSSLTASESARGTPQQWFELSGDAWQETEADEKVSVHEPPAERHLLDLF